MKIIKDYQEVKRITKEFNEKFAFKNEKVEFCIPLYELQQHIEKPKMVPVGTPFIWVYPYYRLEHGVLYFCASSQFEIAGNHERVNPSDIMTDEEWEKFVEGTKFYEKNYK